MNFSDDQRTSIGKLLKMFPQTFFILDPEWAYDISELVNIGEMDPCYQECLVREMQCLTSKLLACQEEEKRLKRAQFLCLQNQCYPCRCGRYGCRCNMQFRFPCVPYVSSPSFSNAVCPPCPPCPLIPAITTKFEERIQPTIVPIETYGKSKSAQVIVAPKPSPYESTILSHTSNQKVIAPVSNQAILVPQPSKTQSAANQRVVMPKSFKAPSNQKIHVQNTDQKIHVTNTNQRIVMPKKGFQMAQTKDQQKIMVNNQNQKPLPPKKTFVSNQAVIMPKPPTQRTVSSKATVNQGVSITKVPSKATFASPVTKSPAPKTPTKRSLVSKSAASKTTTLNQGVSIKRPASTAPSAKSASKKTVISNQAVVMPRKIR